MSRLVDQQLDPGDPETLVGAFQKLRPDCQELEPLFELLPGGAPVFERLEMIYRVAGEPRRPDGMKDAFFVVRNPVAVEPGAVRRQAERIGTPWPPWPLSRGRIHWRAISIRSPKFGSRRATLPSTPRWMLKNVPS